MSAFEIFFFALMLAIAAGLVMSELEHRARVRELGKLKTETERLEAEIVERRRRLHLALMGSTLEPPTPRREWLN